MKHLLSFSLVLALAVAAWNCTSQVEGTHITGVVKGAENLQVYLDRVVIGKANAVLSKAAIGSDGSFRLEFPEGLEPGVYNLRIGAKKANLVLDGAEEVVDIQGELGNLERYDFQVSGSADSRTFAELMRGLVERRYSADNIRTFVDTTSNPTLGAYVAYRSLGGNYQFLDIQKTAQKKLAQADPGSEMAAEYGKYIGFIEQQYLSRQAQEKIKVGQPAPDISLPDPDGKEYSLSDLKGKIVLLDFWASWCGPCRRENPNVVEVYKKYRDQGFTVFSVSLDGVDSRTLARMGGDAEKAEQMKNISKQRWEQAIDQDNLIWDYHVSDLKKWESQPAALYGVRSIPKAFLIDREGKIAAVGVRGAAMIEQELQKLL